MFSTHATSLYESLYVSFYTVLPQQILFTDISFNNILPQQILLTDISFNNPGDNLQIYLSITSTLFKIYLLISNSNISIEIFLCV